MILTLSQGCRNLAPETLTPIPDPGTAGHPVTDITLPYPPAFDMLHHVILTIAGKNYVFDGYLSIDLKEKKIHITVQNSLGGVLFTADHTEGEPPKIHINLNTFKESWVKNAVLRDLKLLYLPKPLLSPHLFTDTRGYLVLSGKTDEFLKKLYFEPHSHQKGHRLAEIRLSRDNRPAYLTIRFGYGDKKNENYPDTIMVEDKKMKYRLQIKAIYFINTPDN